MQADVVIESSDSHHGLASAIQGAVRGGKVVMVCLLPSGPQPALISLAITRELELLGSFRFNDEIDDVIAASRRLKRPGTRRVRKVLLGFAPVDSVSESINIEEAS